MIDRDTTYNVYANSSTKQKYLFSSKESDDRLFSIAQKYDLDKDMEKNKLFTMTVGDIILGFYKIEDTVPLLQQELGLDPRTSALLGADVLDFLAPLSDPNWQPPVEGTDDEDSTEEDEEIFNETKAQLNEHNGASLPPNQIPISNNQPAPAPYQGVPPLADPADLSVPTSAASAYPVATQTPDPGRQGYQSLNQNLHTMAGDMAQARSNGSVPSRPAPTLNLENNPTYVSQNQDSLRKTLSDTPTYNPATRPNTPYTPPDIEPPRWSTQ